MQICNWNLFPNFFAIQQFLIILVSNWNSLFHRPSQGEVIFQIPRELCIQAVDVAKPRGFHEVLSCFFQSPFWVLVLNTPKFFTWVVEMMVWFQLNYSRWWQLKYFYVHPCLGKWSNLTSIFFRWGWFNHQLGFFSSSEVILKKSDTCLDVDALQGQAVWKFPIGRLVG